MCLAKTDELNGRCYISGGTPRISRRQHHGELFLHLRTASPTTTHPNPSPRAFSLPLEPTMNSTRLFRPFARAAFRQPAMARPSVMARPALAAAQNKKNEVAPQQMTILKSAMPQLIPFFFVNETTMAFVLLPTLIYVLSKYILPQRVRLFAARLFISKL
ncbi:hypothetical protein PMIN06_006335 [Paraphaeosphaeria minitans]